jgi:hypothetical protein
MAILHPQLSTLREKILITISVPVLFLSSSHLLAFRSGEVWT